MKKMHCKWPGTKGYLLEQRKPLHRLVIPAHAIVEGF